MNLDSKTLMSARQALREAVRRWIYDPNVRLIDLCWSEQDHTLIEDKLAIRVHVVEKFEQGPQLEAAMQRGITRGPIQPSIGEFPVVVQKGAYRLHGWWDPPAPPPAHPRARRAAPLQGGISVANGRIRGYGTLGGGVIDRETGAKMILSNWHVLVGLWHARPGWPIYQPGQGDGGTAADTVATLSRDAMATNLDAAVAELTGVRSLINAQFGLVGPVKGVGWAQPGMAVVKSGRASEVTYGRVSGVEGTARMTYSGVPRLIRNVMTIDRRKGENVSTGGDSGSWWLEEETMNVVGLHFAGSDDPERALAIDMQPILEALKVDILI